MTDMATPILSVCIPTYNRAAFLRESLTSVFRAIEGLEDAVEVLVSDNASSDDTSTVIAEFQSRYPQLRYNRNLQNVIDENFFIAADLARGEYVWVFADDDLMEETAISRVLKEISCGYNLLILNYSIWDNEFSVKIRNKYYPVSADLLFTDHDEFLKYFSIKAQFISSVVVKKNVLFTLPEAAYKKMYEYGFSYLLAICAGVSGRLKALLVSETMVRYRGDNSDLKAMDRWYKCFATGSTMMLREVHQYGYSAWAIYCAKHQVLKSYIFRDISNRRRSGDSMAGIFRLILPYYAFQGYFWLIIVPMLFVPAPMLRTLHYLAHKFRG
jgi:abequosyltransferase